MLMGHYLVRNLVYLLEYFWRRFHMLPDLFWHISAMVEVPDPYFTLRRNCIRALGD